MLRELRRRRLGRELDHHLMRVQRSLSMRSEYEAEGRKGMVLAVNYELVSDSTRALQALRQLEELTPHGRLPEGAPAKIAALRTELTQHCLLPAIPAWRIQSRADDRASPEEIEAAYQAYRQMGAGGHTV